MEIDVNCYPEKKVSIKIGIVGCGGFARCFVPLFKAHPYVEKVTVCDLIKERADEYAAKFNVETVDTYENMLKSDVNCIAVFVQRHLHGPIVKAALNAGKNVYCAVPMASTVDECQEIVELVKKTGLVYMMGETCIYYPCSMFCKKVYREGGFGKFIYGASQYYHDISHFDYQRTEGPNWKRVAGVPPMLYPTHSTAMILAAVNSYVTRVTGFGYEDMEYDGIFERGANLWDNPLSNTYAMMQLADGGTARVSECRRIGWRHPSSFISGLYGTKGGYECSVAQHVLVKETPERSVITDVSDQINLSVATSHKNDPDFLQQFVTGKWSWSDFSPQQMPSRLPESFKGLPNGHMGSHQFLVDDFCRAVNTGKLPPVHAWAAARYTIPGLVAHASAMAGAVPMNVPDCGEAPADLGLVFPEGTAF